MCKQLIFTFTEMGKWFALSSCENKKKCEGTIKAKFYSDSLQCSIQASTSTQRLLRFKHILTVFVLVQ